MTSLAGTRLAFVNWRDLWHPEAGGAEKHAWELAKRLVLRGAQVSFVSARAPGQARAEQRDGVEIVRMGGRYGVYPQVLAWMLRHRRSFDVVIDCQNGIPFFTPLVLPRRVPVFCVIHHVHYEQWGLYFPPWLAWVGRMLEGPVARRCYRRHACITVSPSTGRAIRERLRWRIPVYYVPNAISAAEPPDTEPQERGDGDGPRLAWVGRLVPHKRVELVLDIAERLRDQGATIDIVGHGPAGAMFAAEASRRGLAGMVRLRGFLPEEEKEALVCTALLHLNTSQSEGWGLSVLEAAALGVPTAGYDVAGIRDAICDGRTGWLVPGRESMADVVERALKELSDPARRREISSACRAWAAQFDWDHSAERLARLVAGAIRTGTAQGSRGGAWVAEYRHGPERRRVVLEGPALDLFVHHHADTLRTRPATPAEQLLGRTDGAEWP